MPKTTKSTSKTTTVNKLSVAGLQKMSDRKKTALIALIVGVIGVSSFFGYSAYQDSQLKALAATYTPMGSSRGVTAVACKKVFSGGVTVVQIIAWGTPPAGYNYLGSFSGGPLRLSSGPISSQGTSIQFVPSIQYISWVLTRPGLGYSYDGGGLQLGSIKTCG